MHDDDKPVGRVLSRREILALLGTAGVGLVASRAGARNAGPASPLAVLGTFEALQLPACVVRPQQTEGPYFVDELLDRSDIRSDPPPGSGAVSEGIPLDLEIRVSRVGNRTCTPLPEAMVDVWQCDALGVYSDVRDMNGFFDTRGKKFLRGFQRTDKAGRARFRTIYPGWYQGRTVHIHFKIRTPVSGSRAHEFTSQLYFDDALSDEVFRRTPYAKTGRRVLNEQDGIFRNGGRQLMLALQPRESGYTGSFDIGLALGE